MQEDMYFSVTTPGRACAHGGAALIMVLLAASTAAAQSVRGTATFHERMALPPNATFEALLEDVSRADAAAEIVGRTQMMPPGNPPITFEIRYDPAGIQPNHTYSVRARILVGDQLLFTSDTAHPVLTRGNSNLVNVLMRRTAAAPITAPGAQGGALAPGPQAIYWKATELAGRFVTAGNEGREAHLVLGTDGRATGSDGCNRFAGRYELSGQALRFGTMVSTEMACQNSVDTERAFRDALNRTTAWRMSGNRLEVVDAGGTVLARFEPAVGK